ncbi:ubiquitin-conjugating enzyme/RWD-like protein [Dissophora ornata]|nr:ubiquitin-conjugating enzyme/RWD-like protein [Dissophora ornata]
MDAISSTALRKVSRELYMLKNDPPEGIRLILNEDTLTDIQAWIQGPVGTPYEGGCFRLRLQLSADFPNSPPKCKYFFCFPSKLIAGFYRDTYANNCARSLFCRLGFFLTKIFHPNVSKQGDVCVSTLKKDWKKDLGLRHVLLVVKCLLIVPNPESALNEEAGRQLLEHYDDYAKHARLITSIHAQSPGQDIFAVQSSSTKDTVVNSSRNESNSQQEMASTSIVSRVGPVRVAASKASTPADAPTAGAYSKTTGIVTGEQLVSPMDEDMVTSASISIPKAPSIHDPTAMALCLKRKLPQEENSIEQPQCSSGAASHTKHQVSAHCGRQTLQGLPTHQNQTPARNCPSLKQIPGHNKHEPLKDKVQESIVRASIGATTHKNVKGSIENRKRTLRRL